MTYEDFWRLLFKEAKLIKKLKSEIQEIKIDVRGIEGKEYGKRDDFKADFKIVNGEPEYTLKRTGKAPGRSFEKYFWNVLKSKNIEKYLFNKILKIEIPFRKVDREKDKINLNPLWMEIKIKAMETEAKLVIPKFFTQEDFAQLEKFAGMEYQKDIPGMDVTYQHLKETYLKVEYWAQQVVLRTLPKGVMAIRKRPTNQANKFETYHWAKLYPNPKLEKWKVLAFTLTFSKREDFCVKIDTVGLNDNDPIRKKYVDFRGDFSNSPIVVFLKGAEILTANWDTLIQRSSGVIKSLMKDYEKLLDILEYKGEGDYDSIESSEEVDNPLNSILYGPPGTGKTYHSIDKAIEIALGKSLGDHTLNKTKFDQLRKEGQIEFVTFHQNYTYEDFIVGLGPDVSSDILRFKQREGIFKKLVERAKKNWRTSENQVSALEKFETVFARFFKTLIDEEIASVEIQMRSKGYAYKITSIDFDSDRIKFTKKSGGTGHDLLIRNVKLIYDGSFSPPLEGLWIYYYPLVEKLKEASQTVEPEIRKNFVLIIDEINRANISKVFGELITLLEDDKRLGAPNELKVTLPNGETDFGIPPNLYVIGTMNTADKSIALIDIALRRRFEFIGMYPKLDHVEDAQARKLLEQINKAIFEKKGSADYLIGHAYFMNDKSIEETLNNKVIPLLLEYFMGKISFVEDVFKNTGWKVIYNKENYSWDIAKP